MSMDTPIPQFQPVRVSGELLWSRYSSLMLNVKHPGSTFAEQVIEAQDVAGPPCLFRLPMPTVTAQRRYLVDGYDQCE